MAVKNEKVNIIISAKDQTKKTFSGIKTQIVGIASAYAGWHVAKDIIGDSIASAAKYEATMKSLRNVVNVTGRDMNDVYREMRTHIGGLASEASVAEGFLKGMTTELNVQQISQLTTAVKNASIAMGEDFNVQLPLIIKALKQLNPAILDNIGVTVRLDQVNKKIRDGFYGAGTEINEYTQQHAILQEILRQTNKFMGQEAEYLKTVEGRWRSLTVAWEDFKKSFGEFLLAVDANGALSLLTEFTRSFAQGIERDITLIDIVTAKFNTLIGNYDTALKILTKYDEVGNKVGETFSGLKIPSIIPDEDTAALDRALEPQLESITEFADIVSTTFGERAEVIRQQIEDLTGGYSEGWAVAYGEDLSNYAEYSSYLVGQEEATNSVRTESINQWVYHNEEAVQRMMKLYDDLAIKVKVNSNILGNSIASSFKSAASRSIGQIKFLKEETSNVLIQIGQQFVQTVLETIASLIIEAAKVQILTNYYKKLATVKAASNPFSAGAAIAAATSVASFLTGFDDPVNDAVARRHGYDYATEFMRGQQQVFGAPNYANQVVNMQPERSFAGGGNNITINIENVDSEDRIEQIKEAIRSLDSNLTGSLAIGAM